MNSLRIYLRERFPLPVTALLSLATAALLVTSTGVTGVVPRILPTLIVAVLLLSFMFRMRVADEFKDSAHDDQNYPNRPVQRGVITRSRLLPLGIFAFVLELACASLVSIESARTWSLIWYLPVIAYSALTFFEFFAPTLLHRHFNLYFVLHQGVFVAFAAWAQASLGNPHSATSIIGGSSFVLFMAVAEVARKYEARLDTHGKPVPDTYITVWGRTASSTIMAAGLLVATVLLFAVAPNVLILVAAIGGAACIGAFRESDRNAQAVFYLTFISISVISVLS